MSTNRPTILRRTLLMGAAVLFAGSFMAACSDVPDSASGSGERDAAGATTTSVCNTKVATVAEPATSSTTTTVVDPSGTPCEKVNVAEFCKNPNFSLVRDITVCFQLENRTKRFSAPNTLDARFELTVPYALCGPTNPKTPCRENTGYRGTPRDETLGNTYGRRTLRPNPFADTGYIQFQPDAIWQGVHARLFIGSQQFPMSLSQSLAQADFENPSSGTNGGNCDTQGEFFTCSLDRSSWSTDGTVQSPRFVLGTMPLRIRVDNTINSTTVSLKLVDSSPGSGLLLDPVAQSGLDLITKGKSGFTGGYRQTNGLGSKTWTSTYCVQDGSPDCSPVDINIAYSIKEGKVVNESTCKVTNMSRMRTYICNQPTLTGPEEDLIATINISDF